MATTEWRRTHVRDVTGGVSSDMPRDLLIGRGAYLPPGTVSRNEVVKFDSIVFYYIQPKPPSSN